MQKRTTNTTSDCVKDNNTAQTPVINIATQSMARAPRRSSIGPSYGEAIAASTPQRDTAADKAVRDQPNSPVIGSTKIESVATAGPCRANPAQHTQANTTQP